MLQRCGGVILVTFLLPVLLACHRWYCAAVELLLSLQHCFGVTIVVVFALRFVDVTLLLY